ncbi:MAG TPA: c-type cytochrome [Blastocatellia bacterium]|jgi:cbb3-type cytochrome c oxidase subunit III
MNRERLTKLPVVSAAVAAILLALLSHSANGVSVPAASAADGTTLFGAKCALCHGKNGAGLPNWKAKGQPDFTNADWQKSHSDAQIVEAVKNGKGKFMPAFKAKLSDDEIAAVVARVRALGKKK